MADLLTAVGVRQRFGALKVLDGVDFAVRTDEAVGIVGPNGAGKTTLLNVLAGVYRPTAGVVRHGDREVTEMDAAERCRYSTRISLALRLNYAKMEGLVVEDTPFKDEPPIDEMMKNMIIGDAHACAQRIIEDVDAMRATHIALYSQPGDLPHKRVIKSLEKFAVECVPLVTKELAKRGVTVSFGPQSQKRAAAAE